MSVSVSGTYEVGDNTLILRCEGMGSPTVVLEAGTGTPMGRWQNSNERWPPTTWCAHINEPESTIPAPPRTLRRIADLLAGENAYCAGDDGGSERFDGNASFWQEQSAPAPPDIPFELTISSVDADWCPPDQSQPGPFASQDQCHAAHDIHRRLAEEIVTQWPQGGFSEIDAPHEIYTTDLDTIVAIVQGVDSEVSTRSCSTARFRRRNRSSTVHPTRSR